MLGYDGIVDMILRYAMARHYVRQDRYLKAEIEAAEMFAARGFEVVKATREEQINLDIDYWLNGDPISFKWEEAGVRYKNIYLEIATQIYQGSVLSEEAFEALKKLQPGIFKGSSRHLWYYGWWLFGKAKYYHIRQGEYIYVYPKHVLKGYLRENGYLRIRSLSKAVKESQTGKDTIIGCLPNTIWTKRYSIGIPTRTVAS